MRNKEKKLNFQTIDLIRLITEEESEYFQIKPEELYDLLKIADDNMTVTRLPKFKGKPLEVMGKLDLSDREIEDLGNIKKVNGNLDISHTKISNISDVVVSGYVSDYGTPIQYARLRKIKQDKLASGKIRKETGEWDLTKNPEDNEAIKANILYDYLVMDGTLEEMDEEKTDRLKKINIELEELSTKYDEVDDTDEADRIYDKINELEEERDEILENTTSIYNLIPKEDTHYGLLSFEIVTENDSHDGGVYTVGDESEMDEAVLEYAKNYIDDVGIEGFTESFLEDYIDKDSLEGLIREIYENDIRDNPEYYFNDDDFKLSVEQEKRMSELETYIESMDEYIEELNEEQNNLEDEIEDPQEYSKKWDEIQSKIEEAESKKDEAQDEIDGIEPDSEPTEDMIEEKMDEMIEDKLDYPISFIKEHGVDFTDYIDLDELAKGLVSSDGYGIMNSYNSDYATMEFNNETYYIMRVG